MESFKRLCNPFSMEGGIIIVNGFPQYNDDVKNRFSVSVYKNLTNCRIVFHYLLNDFRERNYATGTLEFNNDMFSCGLSIA